MAQVDGSGTAARSVKVPFTVAVPGVVKMPSDSATENLPTLP